MVNWLFLKVAAKLVGNLEAEQLNGDLRGRELDRKLIVMPGTTKHRELSERRGFRGPGHLVSGADWIPGTASTPVSLSHQSDEA